MKFKKIIETCIYCPDLQKMKDFYVDVLGLEVVTEEPERHLFLKAGKNMLLIFNPQRTLMENENIFPPHGALTPPSILHLAFEVSKEGYEEAKELLKKNNIEIESELAWEDRNSKSTYFRDPAGNLVEIITEGAWPVED